MRYKIVETDNFGGDYPNEKNVNLPSMTQADAQKIAVAINGVLSGGIAPRYWVVKTEGYELQGGDPR